MAACQSEMADGSPSTSFPIGGSYSATLSFQPPHAQKYRISKNFLTEIYVFFSYKFFAWHFEKSFISTQKQLIPFFIGMKVKQRKSVFWLFLKMPLKKTISMKSSQRDFFIDMVVDRFSFIK